MHRATPPTAPTAPAAETVKKNLSIKVFGVGNAGLSVLEPLIAEAMSGMSFFALNTDAKSLATSSAPEKLQIETKLFKGLGAGGDPENARAAAEHQAPRLKGWCEGADLVFIVAGLGGSAGTGISPVLARVAKEAGSLALAFVTTPFACECAHRQALAQQGVEELKAAADGVICLANQKVCKLIDENTSVLDTFNLTNQLLAEALRGVWRLLQHSGLIEIHFGDLCALIRDRHSESSFATAEAAGPARSREVLDKLLAHPMLDGGQMLGQADAVLVSLLGGPDLAMAEVNRVMEEISRHSDQAQIIMGAAIDETFRERLAVTLIAARKDAEAVELAPRTPACTEELGKQLLNDSSTPRPNSRFVPPPPALPPEKVEQLLARQNRPGSRPRKSLSKPKQTQLPLEIVSKGRFDKSEPTIHKGEDLDVPTYIRRGIALN